MKQSLNYVLISLLLLIGCKQNVKELETSNSDQVPNTGYVLSGDNIGKGFKNNSITIFDKQSWLVRRKVDLPMSWVYHFSRDVQGRLWVGFSGDFDKNDNLVQIYSSKGDLLKSLRPCTYPSAGIVFAKNNAFIACKENGFSGKIAVVNLDTFSIVKTIELKQQDSSLLLISSAANEKAVLVSGLTSGSGQGGYTVISIIDPESLEIRHQVQLGENTDVWRIIPYRERFYLLNVGSWRQSREMANDVIVIELAASPKITRIPLFQSPLWGQIDGNFLYSYHNPTHNQPNDDPIRLISRLDLTNNQVKTWNLPDNWNASDLTVIDSKVVLTRWTGDNEKEDGLYQFDPTTGKITKLLLNVLDASKTLVSD